MKRSNFYMEEAYKEAKKAYDIGEVPVGAVIVKDGTIIAAAHNEKETGNDATMHAEISAIKRACRSLSSWRLSGCDIYVTLEPCTMCIGAILQARLDNLYIGAFDPKAGACGSVIDIPSVTAFNHKVNVYYGIMEEECSQILKDFFNGLRSC